ncbi:hypothetical protein D3C72_2143130 [compost metagenome]
MGSPRPRKLSADSSRIELAIIREPDTITGDRLLGRICVRMMRRFDCPDSIAAWTNSRFFRLMNSARTSRASGGQDTTAMAKITVAMLGVRIATSTTARKKLGMVWNSSMNPTMAWSTRPP